MEALARARQERSRLHIVYLGLPPEVTEHDITPLEWIVEDLFRASCYTTGQERTFHVFSIVKWWWLDTSARDGLAHGAAQPPQASPEPNNLVQEGSKPLTARDMIEEAINRKGEVRILYRDYDRNETDRVITPLYWESDDKVRAYCHMRQKERSFRTFNIMSCVPVETNLPLAHRAASSSDPPTEPAAVAQGPTALANTVRTISRVPKPPVISTQPRVTKVSSADEWSRLLAYYADCLERENRQKSVVKDPSAAHFFVAERDSLRNFLAGMTTLEFEAGTAAKPSPLAKYVRKAQKFRDQVLCVGYPCYVLESGGIAPLLISPVRLEDKDFKIQLNADECEISLAALDKLRLTDEEIAAILEEYARVEPQPGQLITHAREAYLAQRLGEVLGVAFRETTWRGHGPVPLEPGALYTGPCLFWMGSNPITGNLILELRDLALAAKWPSVPAPVKLLLSTIPEHDYPPVLPYQRDQTAYVTAVNERQRRAVAAVQSEPVVVVTGPPGTGKSQLVLNLIAQAVARGETVLFGSRINKAVDVVMERLQQGIGFGGAVRTGRKEIRKTAVSTMGSVLEQLSASPRRQNAGTLRERYTRLKVARDEAESSLLRVREFQGLANSHESERDALLKLISAKVAEVAQANAPQYRPDEAEHLQNTLRSLRQFAFGLREKQEALTADVLRLVQDNTAAIPLVALLHQAADQWGSFGDRLLDPPTWEAMEDIQAYIGTWLELLPVLDMQALAQHCAGRFRALSAAWEPVASSLPGELQAKLDDLVARLPLATLRQLATTGHEIERQTAMLAEARFPWLTRLLIRVGLQNPVRRLGQSLEALETAAGLGESMPRTYRFEDRANLALAATRLARVLSAGVQWLELQEARAAMELVHADLDVTVTRLSPNLKTDISRLSVPMSATEPLRPPLESIQVQISSLLAERRQLVERVNSKLDGNADALRMLTEFRASPAGQYKRLWSLKDTAMPVAILGRLGDWQNILALWATTAALDRIKLDLAKSPSEADALAKVKELDEQLYAAGAELASATWHDRSKGQPNEVMDQANRYVAAVRQLVAVDGNDPAEWQRRRELAAVESACLPAALQVFPVWATTNLSAKSNLPLTPGLFDLVIIDEASQCDVASALPLLYRAKRVVVIGDPKQLRHVATLDSHTDAELAARHGIASDTFGYNDLSLYDIAQRSVGNRPGTMLLNEHYRSDSRIIGFSNAEFYGRELVIRTDLARLGLPDELLNNAGGVFWLDVAGEAQHPAGGSAFNQEEVQTLRKLVPWLQKNLVDRKLGRTSLGVVTPYREQDQRIQQWFNDTYAKGAGGGTWLAGTAHAFQGDEKDIILFSTVLAPGLNPGSLRWLQDTANLLNVAVTRARVALLVVGHHRFCRSLPTTNIYRRLADYVASVEHRVVQSITDLPLFSGEPFSVIGKLVDRRDKAFNRTTFRNLLLSCKGFIWCMDPYMTSVAFEYLASACQDPDFDVRDLRILTTKEQLDGRDGRAPDLTRDAMRLAQDELRRLGITLLIGLAPKAKLPHDRYLYSQGQAINMPPIMGAIGEHRMVSEYTQSITTPDFFDQHWRSAEVL